MIAVMRLRSSPATACLLASALMLSSCEYRLYGFIPPSQELIQIVAKTPGPYVVQLQTGNLTRKYEVPLDGRVTVVVPTYRLPCGVYLLNAVKVGGYGDPLKGWNVSVTRDGSTVRELSVRAVLKLPVDRDGYRTLRLKD